MTTRYGITMTRAPRLTAAADTACVALLGLLVAPRRPAWPCHFRLLGLVNGPGAHDVPEGGLYIRR